MKRTAGVLGVAAVALWSAGVFAQGRNFAGSWTIDSERMAADASARVSAGGGGGGGVMVAAAGSGGGGVARSGGGGGGGAVGAGGGAVMARAGDGSGGFAAAGGGRGGGGGRGAAGPTTIALDASTFTVGTTAYKLDGSVTTTETPRGTVTAKAAWKADKLVIETTNQGANGPVVSTTSWYLDGESLIRETSTPGPDGGESRVSKVYYKRA